MAKRQFPHQPSNIVTSQMMPPISAHATGLCKSGSPFDETLNLNLVPLW